MYVLSWMVILCCWRGTAAKSQQSRTISVSPENRTRVALTGQTLTFNLSLNIPVNRTYKSPDCYHQSKRIVWDKQNQKNISNSNVMLVTELKMHNVSFSGSYYCRYEGQEAHWVALVRDKCYEEPRVVLDKGIIIQMSVSGILLIFSVAGSLYILKSYKKQPPNTDKNNEVTEQRPEDAEDAAMDEDVASASVYTALQHRTSTIYDMLNPENNQEKSKQKDFQNYKPQDDDELFDSVYENF